MLQISANLHDGLRQYLERGFPNEAGGFLIGTQSGQTRTVTETRFVENTFETEEQYHRYLMEEGAYEAAEDYADANGLVLVGYFHSHPDHPAIPSEFDRVHAWPNFVYLIVSVRSGAAAESRAWHLVDDRTEFHEMDIEIIAGGE